MSANLILRTLVGGTTNTTKNSPLTNAEMDQNFINLDNEIDSLASSVSSSAPSNSPALTGTPTAPTAASGTSTTQLATTAFVAQAVLNNESAVAMAIALG